MLVRGYPLRRGAMRPGDVKSAEFSAFRRTGDVKGAELEPPLASPAGGLVGCRRYGVDHAGKCYGGDGEDRDCDGS